jgi:hypothetical protein
MNSNIEPQHDPPPASPHNDVVNKLDEIHLDSNNPIEDEDTPMMEVKNWLMFDLKWTMIKQ